LADGAEAVHLEAHHQARRYVTGTAVAMNSRGKTVSINLDTIHDTARKLGPNITRAECGIVCLNRSPPWSSADSPWRRFRFQPSHQPTPYQPNHEHQYPTQHLNGSRTFGVLAYGALRENRPRNVVADV
jgi:hypothetical protein